MSEILAVLTLTAWVGAVAVLVGVDRGDRVLWLPVVLAVAGVFSSVLPLAISLEPAWVANGVILTLFIVALQVPSPERREVVTAARCRVR